MRMIVSGGTRNLSFATFACWQGNLRRLRGWLSHNGWYAALLLLLSVCMLEPLSCILHCQPWLHAGATGAQHAHHHTSPADAQRVTFHELHASGSPGVAAQLLVAPASQAADCSPDHAPAQSQAEQAHEHAGAVLALVLLALVLLINAVTLALPRLPAPWPGFPPLRPPILPTRAP